MERLFPIRPPSLLLPCLSSGRPVGHKVWLRSPLPLCCWSARHPGFFTMDLNVHLLDYHKVEGNICNPPKPLCTTLQRKVLLRNADFPGIWAWREIAISTEKRPPQPPGGFASANCNLTIPSVPPHGPFRKCYILCQEHSGCDFVEFLKTTKCIHIGTNLQ